MAGDPCGEAQAMNRGMSSPGINTESDDSCTNTIHLHGSETQSPSLDTVFSFQLRYLEATATDLFDCKDELDRNMKWQSGTYCQSRFHLDLVTFSHKVSHHHLHR